MAIADLGSLGAVGNTNNNQASLVLTTTAAVAVGELVVVVVAVDNAASGGDDLAVTAVQNSGTANTWVKAIQIANALASQAGASCSIWYTKATAAIASGATITATFNTSPAGFADASAMTARHFSLAAGNTVVIEGTPGTLVNNTGADPGSLNVTTANVECLRVRGIASQVGNNTNLTPTASWTAWANGNSATTGTTAEMCARAESRINTATGAASDPTYVSAIYASAYVAFKEFTPPTISGTLAVTEGSDVLSMSGVKSDVIGALAATEGLVELTADSTLYTADDDITRNNAAISVGDDATFTGTVEDVVVASGTLAATETTTDTAAFTGSVAMLAVLAATEGADVAAFAGTVGLIGTLAAMEGGTPSTWDTVNKSAITLSNGNLTATVTGAGGVLGNGSISSSKVYWEQTVTTWANNNTAVGLAQSNVNLGTVTSNTTRAATMGRTGSISINNVATGVSLGTRANGNVIGIAVDPVAKLIWFRVAPAGLWNASGTADPATGIGGLSISALTLPLFPLFCGIVTNDACTANFGASAFSGAVPSGFAAGLSSIVGDTAAFVGTTGLIGTLVAIEGADSASFAGTVQWNAALAATEGADTAAFTGTVAFVEITGTLAATENGDTAAFAGTARTLATLAATEAADVAAFVGTVSVAITGVIAATEGADTAAFTVQLGAVGTLAATEVGDVAAFSGHVSLVDEKVGILNAHESGGAVGEIEPRADSTLVTADQTIFTADMDGRGGDQAYFVGEVSVGAVLAATEAADVASFVGIVPLPAVTGILAAQEAADAGRFYGEVFVEVPPWEAVEEGLRNEVQRTVWLAGQGGRVTWLENEVEETFSLQNLNPEVVFLENEVLRITELRP